MKIIVNNDLNNIVFSKHNLFHFWFSFLLAVVFDFQTAYSIGVIYEGTDGIKKSYKLYRPKHYKYFSKIINWVRKNFLFSNYLSLQDLLIFDLIGSACGHVFGRVIRLIF